MSKSWEWVWVNPNEAVRRISELERENAELRAHAERLGGANDRLVVENTALRQQVEHLIGMIEQLEGDLAHFATIEAFEAKKEAQP